LQEFYFENHKKPSNGSKEVSMAEIEDLGEEFELWGKS
jgi:hypothetical protein